MRTWTWLLLGGMGGCFGGSDTGGEDTTDDGATDDDDDDDDLDDICRDVNEYEVDDLEACDQTFAALEQLAFEARHCKTAGDCWVAVPGCEDWVAAPCYMVMNECVDAATVQEFADHGHCTGDNQDQCSGCGSPPDVDCINDICQFVFD